MPTALQLNCSWIWLTKASGKAKHLAKKKKKPTNNNKIKNWSLTFKTKSGVPNFNHLSVMSPGWRIRVGAGTLSWLSAFYSFLQPMGSQLPPTGLQQLGLPPGLHYFSSPLSPLQSVSPFCNSISYQQPRASPRGPALFLR